MIKDVGHNISAMALMGDLNDGVADSSTAFNKLVHKIKIEFINSVPTHNSFLIEDFLASL